MASIATGPGNSISYLGGRRGLQSSDLSELRLQLNTQRSQQLARTLQSGQSGDEQGDKRELRQAATQFEALFIHFMLQRMRQTIERSNLFGQGQSMEIYESLFDQEVASEVAKRGGMGLADIIMRGLGGDAPSAATAQPLGAAALLPTSPPDPASQSSQPSSEVRAQPRAVQETTAAPPSATASAASETFALPADGRISSYFGVRHDPYSRRLAFHKGLDIAVPQGTTLRAAKAGTVVFSGRQQGHGNTVIIKHDAGYTTRYSHTEENLVRAGERIAKGKVIARAGSTGRSTGPHVHFEVWQAGRAINPLTLIHRQA